MRLQKHKHYIVTYTVYRIKMLTFYARAPARTCIVAGPYPYP